MASPTYILRKEVFSEATLSLLMTYFVWVLIFDLLEVQGFFSLFFDFLFISRQRGREGQRKGEKRRCVVASCLPPTGRTLEVKVFVD